MTSRTRPVSSKPITRSKKASAKSAVPEPRRRAKRGLRQPKTAANKKVPPQISATANDAPNRTDIARDDHLRLELQKGYGRSLRDGQREGLSAGNGDDVAEEGDTDVAGQRRSKSIDELATEISDEDQK